jgi:hypothetical protein
VFGCITNPREDLVSTDFNNQSPYGKSSHPTEYSRTIGVVNNGNNNKNREFYAKPAKEFVDYVIEHWDDFAVNIHRKDAIKLTGPVIRSFLEKRGAKLYPGWFVDFVIDEFKRRGSRPRAGIQGIEGDHRIRHSNNVLERQVSTVSALAHNNNAGTQGNQEVKVS